MFIKDHIRLRNAAKSLYGLVFLGILPFAGYSVFKHIPKSQDVFAHLNFYAARLPKLAAFVLNQSHIKPGFHMIVTVGDPSATRSDPISRRHMETITVMII